MDIPNIPNALHDAVTESAKHWPKITVPDGYVFVVPMHADPEVMAWLRAVSGRDDVRYEFDEREPGVLPHPNSRYVFPAAWL
jgi:hypothetical protein